MIVAVIFENSKGEVLVCRKKANDKWTFPNVESDIYYRSIGLSAEDLVKSLMKYVKEDESFIKIVNDFCVDSLGSNMEIESHLESYHRECVELLMIRGVLKQSPKKIKYDQLKWEKLCALEMDAFDDTGKKVLNKIKECQYCRYIHEKDSELFDFFTKLISKIEEISKITKKMQKKKRDKDYWDMAIKTLLIHIRSFYIENPVRKKNITIQNYLKVFRKESLAECFDRMLEIKTIDGLALRDVIKDTVDKYIAHYDVPTIASSKSYKIAMELFSSKGVLPITVLISALNALTMSCIREVLYYAGRLGQNMDKLSLFPGYIAEHERNSIIESVELTLFNKK